MTLLFASINILQGPTPLHAPLHPTKFAPFDGVTIRVTLVPVVNDDEQAAPQLIPAGLLVMVPPQVEFTVSVLVLRANVAVVDLAASISTIQVLPVPLHAPAHPVNVEPDAAVAVSATVAPL